MKREPAVYILARRKNGTLYIGVTSNLANRMEQHRNGNGSAFTTEHAVYRLVHVEFYGTMAEAILREKQLKKWNRAWKIRLIEEENPDWRDLAEYL